MELLKEFCQKFGSRINYENVMKKDGKFFLVNSKLRKIGVNADFIGDYLGTEKNGKFEPSLRLLEILNTKKKIQVNRKNEWLYLCKRDIFKKSLKRNLDEDYYFVVNEHNENLGYGKLKKNLLKNVFDRGDYLRREY